MVIGSSGGTRYLWRVQPRAMPSMPLIPPFAFRLEQLHDAIAPLVARARRSRNTVSLEVDHGCLFVHIATVEPSGKGCIARNRWWRQVVTRGPAMRMERARAA